MEQVCLESLKKFFKNFIATYGIRYAITLFGQVFQKRFKFKLLDQDALKIGLFFGSYTSLMHFIKESLIKIRKMDDSFNDAIAGFFAGLSILFLPKDSHRIISIYIFCHGLQSLYNANSSKVPQLLQNHGNILLFAFSSAQVLYSWVIEPESLPKSYLSFITYMGPIDKSILASVDSLHRAQEISNFDQITKFCSKHGQVANMLDSDFPWGCKYIHPWTESCSKNVLMLFTNASRKILPLYFGLSLFQTVSRKKGLMDLFVNTSRSVLFLSSFVSIYQIVACLFRNLKPKNDIKYVYYICGFICSFALYFEKEEKRTDFTMYTFPRALDSFYLIMRKNGYVKSIPNGEILLFMMSSSIIMYHYRNKTASRNVSSILNKLY